MPDIKKKFETHKLGKGDRGVNDEGLMERKVIKSKVKLDDKGKVMKNKEGNPVLLGGFDESIILVDPGWMVYFPHGASVHIWTEEDMIRQGFLSDPALVNMETGDEVAPMGDTSLRARSEQMSSRNDRSSKSAQI